jgi:Cof subfamily protein (haloacid dehalogenase superfamily)
MGKFDAILICSDWDGPLFANDTVPENTICAIEYFKSKGGLFSISSGRDPSFLKEMSKFVLPNTYCICYGGALIADISNGEIVKSDFLDDDVFETVEALLSSGACTAKINLMCENSVTIHLTPEEYKKSLPALPKRIYKITLNGYSDDDGEIYAQIAKQLNNEKYTLARSYTSYIEIMKTENTKGRAAKMLKEKLGAKLLVGFGDYENDIPLFREVDVSCAVANAVEQLKAISTYTLNRTASDGAMEELLNVLENINTTNNDFNRK